MWDLMKYLDAAVYDSGCDISLLVKELNAEKPVYSLKSNNKVISASTIKTVIMLAALEKVKNNELSLDKMITVNESDILPGEVFEYGGDKKSLLELLYWMIINSDNTSTNAIIKLLGFDYINDYAKTVLGLKSTVLERLMIDREAIKRGLNNYTSMDDMYTAYTLLFNGKILNEELCETAKKILYSQRNSKYLLRYIYEPVKFAHKSGTLSYRNLDTGVMGINGKQYFIGISLCSPTEKEGSKKTLGLIGKTVYDYLKNN